MKIIFQKFIGVLWKGKGWNLCNKRKIGVFNTSNIIGHNETKRLKWCRLLQFMSTIPMLHDREGDEKSLLLSYKLIIPVHFNGCGVRFIPRSLGSSSRSFRG